MITIPKILEVISIGYTFFLNNKKHIIIPVIIINVSPKLVIALIILVNSSLLIFIIVIDYFPTLHFGDVAYTAKQPANAATRDVPKIAALPIFIRFSSVNANPSMKIDIVNPIPAIIPNAKICFQFVP